MPIGTQEQIDKLTDECPDCHGEVGGGGGNSDEPAWTCSPCVGGRVARLSKDGGEEGRDDLHRTLTADVTHLLGSLDWALRWIEETAETPLQDEEPDAFAEYEKARSYLLPPATNQQPQDEGRAAKAQKRHEELGHSASETFTRCPDPGCQIEDAETRRPQDEEER
jgi:hypothetical protein